ncbi:MAG: MiaB/RimO family radical SAM methylthiotransferase, partial [Synergistales bacterium]|nr:MiaB/RimO family radical SAM methylthiotransferase [Synergistales bacterium]
MMDALKGKRIWIYSLGCRSNQYEGEAVANALTEAGAVLADSPEGTDGAVIISCTVTAEADRKCRQAARKAKRMSRNSVIAASGCWAQKITEEEAKSLGIRIVAGNRRKSRIPELLAGVFEKGSPEYREDRVDVMHCRDWDP